MVDLSYWNKDRILLDPMCGSGTIPIEAALIARNVAPGLNRKFASEEWARIDNSIWKQERINAYKAINYDVMPKIYGSDMDAEAIEVAKENAIKFSSILATLLSLRSMMFRMERLSLLKL